MKFHTENEDLGQALAVILARTASKEGQPKNQFGAKAGQALKPIKNRNGLFAVVCNVDDGKPYPVTFQTRDGQSFEENVAGLKATIVLKEDEYRALNATDRNAWLLSGKFMVSINDTADPSSPLYGSLWLEPVTGLDAHMPAGRVISEDSGRAAIQANLAQRTAYRTAAQGARAAQIALGEQGVETQELVGNG